MTMQPQVQTAEGRADDASPLPAEQARRAGGYALLAALLREPPGEDVLAYVGALDQGTGAQQDELVLAIAMLALSARTCDVARLREEYHELFIGIGRGELVPFGSWYQTGFLNERPLSQLRDDLASLGFERADDVREPEDHVAALLEVMAMLIHDDQPLETQRGFFDAHLAPWMERFLTDLGTARNAVFYRAVSRFAQAFWRIESRYLALLD